MGLEIEFSSVSQCRHTCQQANVWLFPWKQGSILNSSYLGMQMQSLLTPSLFYADAIAKHDITYCGISPCSVGVSCCFCTPSQILVCPQPTCGQDSVRSKTKGSWWCVNIAQQYLKHECVIDAILVKNHSPIQLWSYCSVPNKASILSNIEYENREH